MAEPQDLAANTVSSGWDEFRLWGAFLLSLISLVWSERNRRSTNRSSRELRAQTIKLEEFRSSVKTPLLEALAECEDAATKAEATSRSGKTLDQLKQDIEDLNRATIVVLGRLESRLQDANDSSFADGSDWLNEFNTFEDEVLAAFNAASNAVNTDAERRDALLRVKGSLGRLRSQIKVKIDEQINKITPKS